VGQKIIDLPRLEIKDATPLGLCFRPDSFFLLRCSSSGAIVNAFDLIKITRLAKSNESRKKDLASLEIKITRLAKSRKKYKPKPKTLNV